MSKYNKYGPDTVLCCRGHKFWRHELNEEHPETTWMMYEDLKFYDESVDDIKVKKKMKLHQSIVSNFI